MGGGGGGHDDDDDDDDDAACRGGDDYDSDRGRRLGSGKTIASWRSVAQQSMAIA